MIILKKKPMEEVKKMNVRCRTIGDMTCTGVWESNASTIEEIIEEVATTRMTERGGRSDEKRSETSMEDRKKKWLLLNGSEDYRIIAIYYSRKC